MRFDDTTAAVFATFIAILCGVVFILNTALRRNDRVGRIWCLAFVSAIMVALSDLILGLAPSAWWATAAGNGASVLVFGMLWSGLRAANARRSLYGVPLVIAALVVAGSLVAGARHGAWADVMGLHVSVVLVASLGFVEAERGWLARSLNARFLGVSLLAAALYFVVRAVAVLALGAQEAQFRNAFGTSVEMFVTVGIVVVACTTISLVQRERFRRPGLTDPGEAESAGLLGPAQFRELAEVWLGRAARDRSTMVLVLIELANLDEINLAFDRHAGDSAIRALGQLAVDNTPTAALAGRLTRNRAAMLFPLTDEQELWAVTDRINSDALAASVAGTDMSGIATYLGVASTRSAGPQFDDLVETAEAVLELAVETQRPGTVEYAV